MYSAKGDCQCQHVPSPSTHFTDGNMELGRRLDSLKYKTQMVGYAAQGLCHQWEGEHFRSAEHVLHSRVHHRHEEAAAESRKGSWLITDLPELGFELGPTDSSPQAPLTPPLLVRRGSQSQTRSTRGDCCHCLRQLRLAPCSQKTGTDQV